MGSKPIVQKTKYEKKKTTSFVTYLKIENKNTRKGVTRLVIVVVALHVAYCLPPTLLQANKCI
jgi:hypothetical protein